MPRISRTEEQLARYKMSSIVVMEPWETFTNKTMRQFNVQVRLIMKVKPLEVELRDEEIMHSGFPLYIYNKGNEKELR
jgi:hypothetical protein